MINFIKEAFESSWILGCMLVILTGVAILATIGGIFMAVDYSSGFKKEYSAIVIDGYHISEANTSQSGTVFINGKVGIVNTTAHQPEEWVIMARNENGYVVKIECSPTAFYRDTIGSKIIYEAVTGKYSKDIYCPEKLE